MVQSRELDARGRWFGVRPGWRPRWAVLVVCFGVLLMFGLRAPWAWASANPDWATTIEAGLPAGAGSNPNVGFGSVSCASAGNCTAVGGYTDSSGYQQGLLLTETSGGWATGVEAGLPAGAASNPSVSLGSVSCASAGNCTAVGYYTDSSGPAQGLLLTESTGTWATGVKAVFPAGAQSVTLGSVSCASAGNCTAVGGYKDSSGHIQGLLLTETSGAWATGVEASPPAGAGSNPNVSLVSVSCASAGNCTAVGRYTDSSGHIQGLLLTETSGTWSPGVEAGVPANANASHPNVFLSALSCASAGNCTAVGTYFDSSNNILGVLLTETSGVWAPGVEAVLPTDARSNPVANLVSVSCPSAGDCTAVGSYEDSSLTDRGVLLTESSGVWAPGIEPVLPANAGPNTIGFSGAEIMGVSCPSVGNCVAVGSYSDTSGNSRGVTLTESSGAWAPGVEAGLPANAGSGPSTVLGQWPGAQLESVSCASVGNCAAVGTYLDGSSNQQGLLVSATPANSPPAGGGTPPPTGSTPPPAGGTPPPTGTAPAPVLSAVRLGAKKFAASKGTTLKLTVSQAARIRVVITQKVTGHKVKGVCKRLAKRGKKCTITVTKRTVTVSARAGANAFKLKLRGLAKGAYTATITAQNAHGKSRAIRLTFTITHA